MPDRLDKDGLHNYSSSDIKKTFSDNKLNLFSDFINSLNICEGEMRIAAIEAGLSSASKYIFKPTGLFPYFVKLDHENEIKKELKGDNIIRHRIPSTAISELAFTKINNGEGIIVYRFVTPGRVQEMPDRLDVWAQNNNKYSLTTTIDKLFESTLKQLHWQNGETYTEVIDPPVLPNEPASKITRSIYKEYNDFVRISCGKNELKSPIGAIHGDLHAKNILVVNDTQPLLLDFSNACLNQPLVIDFTRLDAFFPLAAIRYNQNSITFPTHSDYSMASYSSIVERLYRSGELILPRSSRPVPSAIHEIRSSFWRGCLSKTGKMTNEEIDMVYSIYLAWNLARFMIKRLDSNGTIHDPGVSIAMAAFNALVTKK